MSLLKELGPPLRMWSYLAVAGGAVCVYVWLLWPSAGRLLPPRRLRAVPWGGGEVVLAFVTYMLWPLAWLRLILAAHGLGPADTIPSVDLAEAQVLALPWQVGTILFLVWRLSGTRPYQLGLSTRRLPANVFLGYLGWLVMCPVVYFLSFAAEWCYLEWTGRRSEPHQLTRLVEEQQGPEGWVLFWLLAVVCAPVLEELLFRGVLLGWARARAWGGGLILAITLAGSALVGVLTLASDLFLEGEVRWNDWLTRALFLLALLPGYLLLRVVWGRAARQESRHPPPATCHPLSGARAVYATAAAFAAIHPWPTPVPLFVLGLGLGWLALRTQSLVGPMVLHALFNTVACLQAWQGLL
jgi:membrane protease YdiL (CAAX protease family)